MELRIEEIDDNRFDEDDWKVVEDFKSKGFKVTVLTAESRTDEEKINEEDDILEKYKETLLNLDSRFTPTMDLDEWENVVNAM